MTVPVDVRGSFWNFIRFRDFPETLRNAKASHFGRGVCGADGEGKDAAKEPDTQRYAPCLSEPSYRNAARVISPGLPSQALARQLPKVRALGKAVSFSMKPICVCWKTSRHRQSLSLWERCLRSRRRGQGCCQRARHTAIRSPVCQSHRIAVLSCFILPGLPSQALARQLSQRESPWQRGFVFNETDLRLLENVTECQSLSL